MIHQGCKFMESIVLEYLVFIDVLYLFFFTKEHDHLRFYYYKILLLFLLLIILSLVVVYNSAEAKGV